MNDAQRTKETVIVEIQAWLNSKKGQDYVCARGYAQRHDPSCEACLLIAAKRELGKTHE